VKFQLTNNTVSFPFGATIFYFILNSGACNCELVCVHGVAALQEHIIAF
jgi:hypothetical protein